MADIEYLYETPDTGALQIDQYGKAYRQKAEPQYGGASLSGPLPDFGSGSSSAKGIGGTEVGVDKGQNTYHPQQAQARQPTPEELMAMADQMEKEFLSRTQDAKKEHSSAVEPALQRSAGQEGPPDWLVQYMEKQPPTDPYHQVMPGRVDIVNANKYLSEQEKLKLLKQMALK